MKKIITILWLSVVFAAIGCIFWYNEWKYSLPTPVPAKYKSVNTGEYIILPAPLASLHNKPVFIHFFNPHCPCSRFNIEHFRSLVKNYGNQVDFVMNVMSKDRYTPEEIQQKYDLNIPIYFDSTIAASCGVYSTPQAAIIDTMHRLYYRGNYNKSRYCTDPKTEYARMAIEALLNKQPALAFDQFALKAYGCTLPTCNKK